MPSLPTTPGNCIRCWSAAEKPATLFRATRFWRTLPLLPSDTSTFRGFIAFRWSAIWTASYPHFLNSWPPVRNELSTGNRYFWHVWVNTPMKRRARVTAAKLRDSAEKIEKIVPHSPGQDGPSMVPIVALVWAPTGELDDGEP